MENRQKLNIETGQKTFYEAYLTKKEGTMLFEQTKTERTMDDLKSTINAFIRLGYTLERAERVEIVQVTKLTA